MPTRSLDYQKFIDNRAVSLLICMPAELPRYTATYTAACLCSRLSANLPTLSVGRGVRQRVPETLSSPIEFIELVREGGPVLKQVVEAYIPV